jgi:hypothetical protein
LPTPLKSLPPLIYSVVVDDVVELMKNFVVVIVLLCGCRRHCRVVVASLLLG